MVLNNEISALSKKIEQQELAQTKLRSSNSNQDSSIEQK